MIKSQFWIHNSGLFSLSMATLILKNEKKSIVAVLLNKIFCRALRIFKKTIKNEQNC